MVIFFGLLLRGELTNLYAFGFEELRIPLTSVKTGKSKFEFETRHPDLDLGAGRRFPEMIRIAALITTVGSDFLLDLQIKTQGEFICDRCGVLFHRNIQGKVQTLFTFQPVDPDVEDDDICVLDPGTKEIELQRDVTDALILAVPVKTICTSTCKGLCPRCGVNLNEATCQCRTNEIDSKWDALRRLKPDN
jgi:uncharacterized protein